MSSGKVCYCPLAPRGVGRGGDMAVFKVLAVDGGGIRGLIPALILAKIEDQTKQRISDMFDLVAGTSTGGILALGLTKPGADGKAEKSAQDVARLYEEAGPTIFP